jgi:hypothetical protein
MLKGVAEIKKIDPKMGDILKLLLAWCSYMNDVRNVVVHKPFYIDKSELFFHNTHTAKMTKKKWVYKCSIAQLNNLSELGDRMCAASFLLPDPSRFPNVKIQSFGIPHDMPDAALLQKLALPDRPADTRQQSGK